MTFAAVPLIGPAAHADDKCSGYAVGSTARNMCMACRAFDPNNTIPGDTQCDGASAPPLGGGVVAPSPGTLPPDNGTNDPLTDEPCNLAQDPRCEPTQGHGNGLWVGTNNDCIVGRDGDNCISKFKPQSPNPVVAPPIGPG